MNTDGRLDALCSHRLVSWEGWAIYSWAMYYDLGLFDKEPQWIESTESWDWTNAIEGVSPYLLKACGIEVPFDTAGKEFYYGEGCAHGDHPPIKIRLTLPEPLLAQLGLT